VQKLLLQALAGLKQDPTQGAEKKVLEGLDRGLKGLEESLVKGRGERPVAQFIEAKRYLIQFKDGIVVLKGPMAGRFVDGTYTAKGKSVADLTAHMARHGLEFAPAVAGQESAYQSLWESLRAYRRGLSGDR
jgi:hypothetical protein